MIDESILTKGQLRKLTALRKALGSAIADEAFAKWFGQQVEAPESDENAQAIADALWSLIEEDRLSIRRGGYIVRRAEDGSSSKPHRLPASQDGLGNGRIHAGSCEGVNVGHFVALEVNGPPAGPPRRPKRQGHLSMKTKTLTVPKYGSRSSR